MIEESKVGEVTSDDIDWGSIKKIDSGLMKEYFARKDFCGVDVAEITRLPNFEQLDLASLGIDSLSMAELVVDVSQDFGIEVFDFELNHVRQLDDFAKLVNEKLAWKYRNRH